MYIVLKKDVDECSPGKADCDGICINMPGAYRCACDKDNILGKDGKKCEGMYILVYIAVWCVLYRRIIFIQTPNQLFVTKDG